MVFKNSRETLQEVLDSADVKINGKRDWDIKVRNPKFYSRVLAGGSLALGESYMDGWWDCKRLDKFFFKVIGAKLDKTNKGKKHLILLALKSKLFNRQSKTKSFEVGEKHYDAGNDLYKKMLDKRLVYSCAYWKNAKTLDRAQEAKLDLICKKIGLKKDMKVLDIGCGWGSFAKFAAEKYKVKVVGITISKEQAKLAKKVCKGLPVEIRIQDYRDLNEKFDRIVSIGMFEHVGYKNYRKFFEVVNKNLKDNGLFLLHTIGNNISEHSTDPWFDKYIFPNGMTPSAKQISTAYEDLFFMEDWHNFGTDYDITLMEWYGNFVKNWKTIKKNYSERFFRMWSYYLLASAGSFRTGNSPLWQIVFSKTGTVGGYKSIR